MLWMRNALIAGAVASAAVLSAPSAQAATVDVTKINGTFIGGTGIPANDFTGATNGTTGESVWLKARGRDSGQPLSLVGTTYTVQSGFAAAPNSTATWWSFDFQFTPPTSAGPTSDYRLVLMFDKDPGAGTNFVTFDSNIFTGTTLFGITNWAGTDSDVANPGPGAWNSNATDYVISQSWRPNFAFIDPTFNPFATGTYQINLAVYAVGGTVALAQTGITVQVVAVPLPPSAWAGLVLMGALGGAGWLKRRKAQQLS